MGTRMGLPGCLAGGSGYRGARGAGDAAPVARIPTGPVSGPADDLGGGIGVDATTRGAAARMAVFYYFYANARCTVASCLTYEAYVSSTDGGSHWSAPEILTGPMYQRQLAKSAGYMTGDYQGVAINPGGRALSAFAVGAVAGTQRLNEAIFEPSGGAPVTGGPNPASPAGAGASGTGDLPAVASPAKMVR